MKLSKVRIILAVIIAALAVMPAATAFAGPANLEYGYETIPGIQNGSSPGGTSPMAESGQMSASQAVDGDQTGGSNFFDAIAGSWLLIVLLVALAAATAYVTWRRSRSSGSRSGLVPGLVALLAVFVAVPLISLSSAQSANRAAAPKGFFGVITQTEFTPADATRMAKGGIETLRVPLSWPGVQPENGDEFNWDATDELIGRAAENGISTLPFLYDSPPWIAKKNTRLPVTGNKARNAWVDFVGAAVARYGTNGIFWEEHGPDSEDPIPAKPVKTWQVWNEANFFYFSNPVTPSGYLTLLKLANKEIKRVDPKAKTMLTGLYGSPPKQQVRQGKAIASYDFLEKLYRMGAKRYFDITALHPYTPNTASTRALVNRFRKVMKKYGDARKPMSITEVGWGSSPRGFLDVGSPAKQAKQVKSAYNYFLKERRKIKLESVYWFAWKDKKRSEPSCNFCYSTGFFSARDGLAQKPAWKAFTRFSGGRP